MPRVAALCLFLAASSTNAAGPLEDVTVDYEVGPLRVFANEGRYGEGGTLYDASDVGLRRNLVLSQRASVELRLTPRQTLVFLWAPLDVVTRVTLARDLVFRNALFAEGTVIDHRYLFEGYRGSWLYRPFASERLALDVGASLQLRNAQVALTDVEGGRYAAESDIGLVVALKARARYTSPSGVYAMLDADGISSFGLFDGGGALLDAALTLGVPVARGVDLFFRARYVGGGADVPKLPLYNWAHLGSATAGLRVSLPALLP